MGSQRIDSMSETLSAKERAELIELIEFELQEWRESETEAITGFMPSQKYAKELAAMLIEGANELTSTIKTVLDLIFVMGPGGSGKSTLAKILLELCRQIVRPGNFDGTKLESEHRKKEYSLSDVFRTLNHTIDNLQAEYGQLGEDQSSLGKLDAAITELNQWKQDLAQYRKTEYDRPSVDEIHARKADIIRRNPFLEAPLAAFDQLTQHSTRNPHRVFDEDVFLKAVEDVIDKGRAITPSFDNQARITPKLTPTEWGGWQIRARAWGLNIIRVDGKHVFQVDSALAPEGQSVVFSTDSDGNSQARMGEHLYTILNVDGNLVLEINEVKHALSNDGNSSSVRIEETEIVPNVTGGFDVQTIWEMAGKYPMFEGILVFNQSIQQILEAKLESDRSFKIQLVIFNDPYMIRKFRMLMREILSGEDARSVADKRDLIRLMEEPELEMMTQLAQELANKYPAQVKLKNVSSLGLDEAILDSFVSGKSDNTESTSDWHPSKAMSDLLHQEYQALLAHAGNARHAEDGSLDFVNARISLRKVVKDSSALDELLRDHAHELGGILAATTLVDLSDLQKLGRVPLRALKHLHISADEFRNGDVALIFQKKNPDFRSRFERIKDSRPEVMERMIQDFFRLQLDLLKLGYINPEANIMNCQIEGSDNGPRMVLSGTDIENYAAFMTEHGDEVSDGVERLYPIPPELANHENKTYLNMFNQYREELLKLLNRSAVKNRGHLADDTAHSIIELVSKKHLSKRPDVEPLGHAFSWEMADDFKVKIQASVIQKALQLASAQLEASGLTLEQTSPRERARIIKHVFGEGSPERDLFDQITGLESDDSNAVFMAVMGYKKRLSPGTFDLIFQTLAADFKPERLFIQRFPRRLTSTAKGMAQAA